ncbi:hypothetical protein LC724_21840 [Blautia sp. RD014234]|nr:hypothetical protein [Blautia parvula]
MVSDLPVKMMLVTVFVSAVTSSGVYTSYIPAGMCLNCRRKDALMGMQIVKLVVAVLMSAITLLLAAVGDWQFVREIRLRHWRFWRSHSALCSL